MRMLAFSVEEEERPIFISRAAALGIDLTLRGDYISEEALRQAGSFDAINVLSDTVITPAMWDIVRRAGAGFAVTRCVGMAHMNADYARSLGIEVTNVRYSPASVADYAIMMMLMVLRHVKPMLQRYQGQDFLQAGLRGRELPNLTVGVVGAGAIGETLIRHLQGFGCRVLYWNRSPKPQLTGLAEARDVDELLGESDIVSLHLTMCPQTEHWMNEERFRRMKPGSVLINTARGGLVDTDALIRALERGQLAGAGLDVFDGDQTIYYRDHKNRSIAHREKAILDAMPNVLMLPHLGYLTDQALEDMVCNSLLAAADWRSRQSKNN